MQAGDLVFAHSHGLVSKGIRWAEIVRFRGGDAYNHVATLDQWWPVGNGGYWTVIQAESRGITNFRRLDEVAHKGGTYTIIQPPASVDTAKQLEFLRAQVGDPYGFLTIVSILVNLFIPKFINVELPGTWICSAVASEALRYGGWLCNWPDIYEVAPAQLYEMMCKNGTTLFEGVA